MSIINAIFQVLFQGCVNFLLWLGDLTGLGYVGINVVIFCIIWPAFTIGLIWKVMKLRRIRQEQIEHIMKRAELREELYKKIREQEQEIKILKNKG